MTTITRARPAWAILHRSQNRLDGYRMWLEGTPTHPCRTLLFDTRNEARTYIKQRHSYIARRPDLRGEPHGWRVPVAARVTVTVAPCS